MRLLQQVDLLQVKREPNRVAHEFKQISWKTDTAACWMRQAPTVSATPTFHLFIGPDALFEDECHQNKTPGTTKAGFFIGD
ncbi:hypothetical protein EJB05_33227, partial [Eragrostis curvula]